MSDLFDDDLLLHIPDHETVHCSNEGTIASMENCEFIIYSKYWVGDNLQHEGVKLLYEIWHGAEDERFKAIRPDQCHEVDCHLMAFKVLK